MSPSLIRANRLPDALLSPQVNLGSHDGQTPLILASVNGKLEAVDRLVLANADVNCSIDVIVAESKAAHARARSGQAALSLAAQEGYNAVVERLLRTPGIEVDHQRNDGQTALAAACKNGHAEAATLIWQSTRARIDMVTRSGQSALHGAAKKGCLAVVRAILSWEIEPAARESLIAAVRNDGSDALLLSCQKGHVEVATELLKAGARFDSRAHDGTNALLQAARRGALGGGTPAREW